MYCAEVSSPNACNTLTNCATVTVLTNTTATRPADLTVCAGSNATFSTVASGSGPFTYMWFHDGVMIPGATGSSMTITNVRPSDFGGYCVKVTGACSSVTNCATLTVSAALGDFVWEDLNMNGRQDAGEPGVSNVTVQLMDCASNVVASTTTDANGFYLFTCLNTGGYRVRFVPPAGYGFTLRDVGSDDLDSDATAGSGITFNCFVLLSGETNRTVDAGLIRGICLGDFVWEDLNGNGLQDAGEPGITNVTLRLLDCATSNVLATTTTDANGQYLFCGLNPGSYRVEIIVPSGYTITVSNTPPDDCKDSDAGQVSRLTDCVTLISGTTNLCTDIGLKKPAALGDFVWEDLNHNGLQDVGEPGVSNVTVQLRNCAGDLITSMLTDVNGGYLFVNLMPSNYVVRFILPAGFQFTLPNVGANDAIDSDAVAGGNSQCVTLISGETNRTVDAGIFRPACLGDFVWEDLNGNGIQDAGEPGITNVTLRLLDCATSNVLATTTTGPNGDYLFCGLVPGSYRVEILTPGGYTIIIPNVGTNDCIDSDANQVTRLTDCVTLVSGETNRCTDIGLKRPAALGDFVWEDLNMNGRQDAGEPGISNVTVQLLDCVTMNLIGITTTDVNGAYLFSGLMPGNYKVMFTPPAGYSFTLKDAASDALDSDADTTTGMTGCYLLLSGQTNLTVDAGLVRPACLGDFVWEDLNHNGRQDAGEPGISNVTLRLIDCATSNILATTTTGPNGQYLFCDLMPGSYQVEIVVPDGYTLTTPNTGTNDCVDSDAALGTRLTDCVVMPSGVNNLCVDIGLKRFSAIGDFVWEDANMNGRQDAGEAGISNVTVRLTDCATMNQMATTTTDGTGHYLFGGLTGGTYKVTFVAPPGGYVFTTRDAAGVPDDLDSDADTTTGMTICYTLPPGTTNLTVDAGIYIPLPPCIDVTKTVACLLPDNQCGPFGKTATGYRGGTNNPAFCYSITISNCGGHTLTNVSVIDNKLGDMTTNFFASKLTPFPPFTTITRFYKMAWDVDTTNTVAATGRAAAVGAQQVSDNDLAVAYVDNASVSCQTIVYSPDDQDSSFNDGHVTLVDDGMPHEVTFTIIVCNSGDVDLANVQVHTPGLAALGCAAPAPFDLAVGACRTNVLCISRLLCTNVPLSLTNFVTASVDTRNNRCGYDLSGSNITTRSECHMEVECGMPGSCRVTGGGRQEHYFPDDVRYVTHGGQVGAPVGNEGFDPGTYEREGSECIHGNWEHVRHQKGGNRGNFHAKIYDSLMCACLACAEDPTANVVVGGLCNPDNRICGPEPRKAPANKICFSGIGDYALTSGNREERAVLFRVDIEDRSEPGNSHAGGGTPPPDRHRIRIWILTPAEQARLADRNDRLLDFRRAISCSPGSTALQDGAIGANGLAVPLGTAVFGVRPPDIDDGGEMDHGNHQIHPMIKDCPK
jgi:protocatechuate 3,4-dioxygenase beta subunit